MIRHISWHWEVVGGRDLQRHRIRTFQYLDESDTASSQPSFDHLLLEVRGTTTFGASLDERDDEIRSSTTWGAGDISQIAGSEEGKILRSHT